MVSGVLLFVLGQTGWEGKPIQFEEVEKRVGYDPLTVEGVNPEYSEHRILWIPKGNFKDAKTGLKNQNGFLVLGSIFEWDGLKCLIYQYSTKEAGFQSVDAAFGVSGNIYASGAFAEFSRSSSYSRSTRMKGDVVYSIVFNYTESSSDREQEEFEVVNWPIRKL